MKYLKTYEGLFDILNLDNRRVRKYIDIIKSQEINFTTSKVDIGRDHFALLDITYTININNNTIETKQYYDKEKYILDISINGKKLSSNENIKRELSDEITKLYEKTYRVLNKLHSMLNKKITINELAERCIEFDLTRDFLNIDEISLNQLFDYYDVKYNTHPDDGTYHVLNYRNY